MVHDRIRKETRKIPVHLVEPNFLAAAYLQTVLERDPCFQITVEGKQLNGLGESNPLPSVFAIDVSTLSTSLEAYLTLLRSTSLGTRILILEEKFSSDELHRLMFLGIQGLLSYNEVKDRLCPALRAISEGHTWFPPDVAIEFQQRYETFKSGHELERILPGIFTPREWLVLGLVKRRLGNKEIGVILKISESTVKFHLSNVFKKLGVRERHLAADVAASPQRDRRALTYPSSQLMRRTIHHY